MEKSQELRDLESTLNQKGEKRKAEIEMLKTDLGHERQAWMTPEDGLSQSFQGQDYWELQVKDSEDQAKQL